MGHVSMAFFLKDYYEFSFECKPVTILIVLCSVFIILNLQNSPVSRARISPLDRRCFGKSRNLGGVTHSVRGFPG